MNIGSFELVFLFLCGLFVLAAAGRTAVYFIRRDREQ